MTKTAPGDAVHYEVQYSVTQALGSIRLADVITDEKIRGCQSLLQKAYEDFFTDAEADLNQLYRVVESGEVDDSLTEIRSLVFNIRALAKVLGMGMITEICVYCVNALESDSWSREKKTALVRKLVGALRLAFVQRIVDDGDAPGKELLQELRSHFA